MKNRITGTRHEIENRLKRLCGQPSPAKRLITVLAICVALAVANVWILVSAIYSIGKNDAEKELIRLQHIKELKINNLELKIEEYEYEQSKNGQE